jgi:hypothetical protein
MLYRGFVVDADGNEQVLEWFRAQLAARGWELGTSQELTAKGYSADFYARGSERVTVRVLGRNFDSSPTHRLPPLRGEKGVLYDIMLSDGESPPGN